MKQLERLIGRLNADGLTIRLAGQNAGVCLDLPDRLYVLEMTQIHPRGGARELRRDESIRHQRLAL